MILWAWESPQNLDFIDPHQTGVAFLAKTLTLDKNGATARPRLQPLLVPKGTPLIAVVRLESSEAGGLPAAASIAPAIADLARRPRIRAVQIDYDARQSERGFYRELIGEVNRRLPHGVPLTITALASWCTGDGWMVGLPVAEAVPMLFRMGPERYRPSQNFRMPLCGSSVGVSMDEPLAKLPRGRRIYIFHPGPWSRVDYRNAVQEVRRWQ